MIADWTTSPNARRVLQHAQDARPAWLWSRDGDRLIWSNAAADLFFAKLKKSGLKLAAPAVPIKGQVARIIRLGSEGRTSLARIQFNAGDKPASATCATTPLAWENGEPCLLIVSVDPIDPDILAAAQESASETEAVEETAPPPAEAIAGETSPLSGEVAEDEAVPSSIEDPVTVEPQKPSADAVPDEGPIAAEDEVVDETTGAPLDAIAADDSYARELHNWQDVDPETVYAAPATIFTPQADDLTDAAETTQESPASEPVERPLFRSLSDLVDRLAADEDLYTPLNDADDAVPSIVPDSPAPDADGPATLFKITGRGFTPIADETEAAAPESVAEDALFPAAGPDLDLPLSEPDQDLVERVSRYNFDELSRILNDRVGLSERTAAANSTELAASDASPRPGGSLVNLGGEALVLNRLPLGILVFRDQQILFANRAITEMTGYGSVEALRQAGLAAVFPSGDEGQGAGPVNHLMQRDGTLVPVTARLQSASWQGRPALMLSASATEVRTGHEDAVRAFAQAFADLRNDGFIELSRAGVVRLASTQATDALGQGQTILGKALSVITAPEDGAALRNFFERPGRFAETERPAIVVQSLDKHAEIALFAQGQAGIVSGYFGFVRQRVPLAPKRIAGAPDVDPALLARISRGVRRPLNTIIGFADLLRSRAFGELGDERYGAYAEDIAAAGNDIAALVDELEDYARLREGRYLAERASLDLTELLESCVLRIRNQANVERIIVRNAISETLPRVTADRASLAQAVLNLLASAIDQSPTGGTVVISAQRMDDGGIAVHVRDSSNHAVDMAERFVVFRDGTSKTGQALAPVRSSVGLALTRSLLAVNTVSLSVDPAGESGVLFSLRIPADLVDTNPPDPAV